VQPAVQPCSVHHLLLTEGLTILKHNNTINDSDSNSDCDSDSDKDYDNDNGNGNDHDDDDDDEKYEKN